MNYKKLSVISPVYRTGKCLPDLIDGIFEALTLDNISVEVILVDDGCPDDSWSVIKLLCEKNPKVKGILLSRNFGQHQAITAGVEAANGDYVVIMDSDLQDNPKLVPVLLKELDSGYDIVFTKRKKRNQSIIRRFLASSYNLLFRFLSDGNFDINTGTLLAFNRQVCNNFLKFKDKERLYIQLFKWLGFKSTYIVVDHLKRHQGKSSYSFTKLLKIGVQGLTTHSDKLLRISIFSGFLLSLSSFIGIVTLLILKIYFDFQAGWPSLVALILFSTGLIQISIGIAGVYIGKIFNQVKDRPLFIVSKVENF